MPRQRLMCRMDSGARSPSALLPGARTPPPDTHTVRSSYPVALRTFIPHVFTCPMWGPGGGDACKHQHDPPSAHDRPPVTRAGKARSGRKAERGGRLFTR
uniref:Uncharacterized protein n=1 Tax=Molossus molossus TaxID=27622 RepID=A0A7J8IA27_MOLMO|nr:hypothetical protein HJG59_010714 [Molossus molossus]